MTFKGLPMVVLSREGESGNQGAQLGHCFYNPHGTSQFYNSVSDGKFLDSGYILSVNLTEFADRLDM